MITPGARSSRAVPGDRVLGVDAEDATWPCSSGRCSRVPRARRVAGVHQQRLRAAANRGGATAATEALIFTRADRKREARDSTTGPRGKPRGLFYSHAVSAIDARDEATGFGMPHVQPARRVFGGTGVSCARRTRRCARRDRDDAAARQRALQRPAAARAVRRGSPSPAYAAQCPAWMNTGPGAMRLSSSPRGR